MSTRCQIDFEAGEQTRRVYRHWDGYPAAVVPDLCAFLAWNEGRTADAEYTAANFLYWSKRRMEDDEVKGNEKFRWNSPTHQRDPNGVLKLGFGVCLPTETHGDIEWLYRVVCGADGIIRIEVRSPEGRVKKTYAYPMTSSQAEPGSSRGCPKRKLSSFIHPLIKKYQCGNCGAVYSFRVKTRGFNCPCGADGDYLELSYWCRRCKVLYSEAWAHSEAIPEIIPRVNYPKVNDGIPPTDKSVGILPTTT